MAFAGLRADKQDSSISHVFMKHGPSVEGEAEQLAPGRPYFLPAPRLEQTCSNVDRRTSRIAGPPSETTGDINSGSS